MPESRSDQSTDGGPEDFGPPSGSREQPSALDDLNRLIQDVRAVGSRLFDDASELVRAQWRLTSYVLAGSLRILALRLVAFTLIALLAAGSWVFLNVALWRAVASATNMAFVPPLALVALNSLTGLVLFIWQKNLRLK